MKKRAGKMISLSLAATMALTAVPMTAWAEDGTATEMTTETPVETQTEIPVGCVAGCADGVHVEGCSQYVAPLGQPGLQAGAGSGLEDFTVGDTSAESVDTPLDATTAKEAKIRETEYDTLEEAFNKVEDNETITLLTDVTIEDTSNVYPNSALALQSKEGVTIDGQGHKIITTYTNADTIKNRGAHVLGLEGCKNVTVNNLKISGEGNEYNGINVYKSTDVTLSDVTVEGVNGGGIVINASTAKATGTVELESNGWRNAINVGWGFNISADNNCTFDATDAKLKGVTSVYTGKDDIENAGSNSIEIIMPEGYVKTGNETSGFAYFPATVKVENTTGTTYFLSLQEAISKAEAGATITLLGDAKIDSEITLNSVNLDLNGKTMSSNKSMVSVNGNVKIFSSVSDGKMINTGDSVIQILSGAELAVEKNVVIQSKASAGIFIKENSSLTVNGANIKGLYYAITGNGLQDNTKIIINDGYIEGIEGASYPNDAVAIYHPQLGDLTINGGTLVGESGVQYCGAGKVTITGGTITAKTEYTEFPSKTSEEWDGTAIDGAALSLISRGGGYQDNGATIDVNITGGNLISENNSAIAVYRLQKVDGSWKTNENTNVESYVASLNITGGKFQSGAQKDDLVIDVAAKEKISITGGTFSDDPSAYVASGYRVKTDGTNYYVSKKSSGSSSSDSSSTGTTTETTENNDGSTTTTVTKPDGTVIETTEKENGTTITVVKEPDGTVTKTTEDKDGSKTVVETKKDGTVTTTETDKEGNKTETVETEDGAVTTTVERTDGTTSKVSVNEDDEVTMEVSVSREAAEKEEKVVLPLPAVDAERNSDDAVAIAIEVKGDKPAKVEIPVDDMTTGTVAVLVAEDGTETVVKTSVMGEDGIVLTVDGKATVKIVDNSKDFDDVSQNYWGADAVQFAASRELFAGTAPATFSPDAPMTRAMVWTVLARLDGVQTGGGVNWYEAGRNWAMENGISDGTNLNGEITREQFASMLYRYAQMKGYDTSVKADLGGYADVDGVSDYAFQAMSWANAEGVINGTSAVTLDAQADSTRAQIATMLMNFCNNVVNQ